MADHQLVASDADVGCGLCGKTRPIMLAMKERDGKPWQLCSTCYRVEKLGNVKYLADEPRMKKGDPMGRSLITGERFVATGEVILAVEHGQMLSPKDEAGSFDRHPNAPDDRRASSYTGGVGYVPDEDGYW